MISNPGMTAIAWESVSNAHMSVAPSRGLLPPGQNAALLLNVSFWQQGSGTFLGDMVSREISLAVRALCAV